MKAVVYDKHASPDMFLYCDVEKPVPNDNEVLVKIYAASVNALDYRLLQIGMGIPPKRIFGADIAGRVEAVGKNIRTFSPGDDVFGDIFSCGAGGFAEFAAVSDSVLVYKPATVSFEEAAAVPVAGITALQALRDIGNIRKGQKVLICGAGGGVGTFAVQLAKYYGAEVTGVCSSRNTEVVRFLGADHVIDYTKEDFTKAGNRYDLIIAVNGNHPLSAYKNVLTSDGIYVMVGGSFSQIFRSIFFGPLMSMGSRKMRVLTAKASQKDLEFLIKLVEAGNVKVVIDRRYPLNKAGEALHYLREGHSRGKVVVSVVLPEKSASA